MRHDPIPAEHQNAWDNATAELAEAAVEVVRANERYNQAILARIAIHELIRSQND